MKQKKDYAFHLNPETYRLLREVYRAKDLTWDELFQEFLQTIKEGD